MNNTRTLQRFILCVLRKLLLLFAVFSTFAVAETESAANYPTKPIRIVVPAPAGGGTDFIARRIGHALSEGLGWQVIVDNRPGANGMIAAELVAKSAPDGYTLLLGHNGIFSINPNLYSKLPYDPVKSFVPITQNAIASTIIVANAAFEPKTLKELIALCRSKPGQISFGSAGTGSPQHLSGELFKKLLNVDVIHVPYKGSAPMIADLAGGQIPFAFDYVVSSRPQIEAGRLRPLAIMGPKRIPVLPDVPTTAELGFPDLRSQAWTGFFAPAGTPMDIVRRLNAEIVKGLHGKALEDEIRNNGSHVVGNSSEEFTAYIKDDTANVGNIVRAVGIKVE